MGRITSQFVNKGIGARSRQHGLSTVSIEYDFNEACLASGYFRAIDEDGAYHELYLTQAEVDTLLLRLVANASKAARAHLLSLLLGWLSEKRLLRTLAIDLRKRIKLTKREVA